MYWNNYQLAYVGSFSSIGNHIKSSIDYKIEIYKKYINGQPPVVQSITFAKDPCIISYLDDEALSPIKGCEITLNILNIDNTLPLSTFYSDSDDEYKIVVMSDGFFKEFEGFLIQDACTEIQTDITHEIVLRFTDGLGLLKNLPFNEAFKLTSARLYYPRVKQCQISAVVDFTPIGSVYPSINTSVAYFQLYNASGLNMNKYDTLYIKILDPNFEYTTYNGIYTINKIEQLSPSTFKVYVDEPITRPQASSMQAELCCITPNDINYACSLLQILKACLHNTGVKLDTFISSQLRVLDSVEESDLIFENVLIEPNGFMNGNAYLSTYDVLEKLMERFNFTIFQGLYRWNIFRFYEKRFQPSFSGYKYDYDFEHRIGASNIDGVLVAGNLTDIEYGITNTITRPVSFINDIYEFSQRNKLIINSDFLETDGPKGNFKYYSTSPVVYRSWNSKYWRRPNGDMPTSAYILDTYKNEEDFKKYNRFTRFINIDRVSNLSELDIYYLKSESIDINYGDEISISFALSIDPFFNGGTLALRFPVILSDGINTLYLSNTLGADNDISGFTTDISEMFLFKEEMRGNVYSVNMRASSLLEGKLSIYLPRGIDQTYSSPNGLSFNPTIGYKDFEINITPFVVGNTSAKNQYNKTSANLSLKNKIQVDSYISDSPKNFMQGALFTKYSTPSGIRIRCENWKENLFSSFFTIQRVMSAQKMAVNFMHRQKLEGNYLAAVEVYTDYVSTRNRVINPAFFLVLPTMYQGKKFVFGKMDINLRENNVEFTAFEVCSGDTPGSNIDNVFNNLFTLTYNTK